MDRPFLGTSILSDSDSDSNSELENTPPPSFHLSITEQDDTTPSHQLPPRFFSSNPLNLLASSIYLETVPPTIQNSILSDNATEEELLPQVEAQINVEPDMLAVRKKYKDTFFAGLYVLTIIAFVLTGVVLIFSTSSRLLGDFFKKSIYATLKNTFGILTLIIISAIFMGLAWFYALRRYTKQLVWFALVSTPLLGIILFIWALTEALSFDTSKYGFGPGSLSIFSLIPLSLSLLHCTFVLQKRKEINANISIIQLSFDVLANNPEIISISVLLLGSYILFCAIWLIFFSRVFLVKNSNNFGNEVIETSAQHLTVFFIFVFFWTTSVFNGVHRATVAGVVSQWYFHRHEFGAAQKMNSTYKSLTKSLTTSLGSICLGGLIMSTARFWTYACSFLKSMTKDSRNVILITLTSLLNFLVGILDILNRYTITFVGLTGEGFCSSARMTTQIMRRSLTHNLVNGFLLRLLLLMGSGSVSFFSGFICFNFATFNLESPNGYISGLVGFLIPFFLLQFFSYIMINIADATFLCYAVDLDSNSCHYPPAKEAFVSS